MIISYSDKPNRKKTNPSHFPGAGISQKDMKDRKAITALAERNKRKRQFTQCYKRIAQQVIKLKSTSIAKLTIERAIPYELNRNLELILVK